MQLKPPGYFCFFCLYTWWLCWKECSSGLAHVGWQGGTGVTAASTGHQEGEPRTLILTAGTSRPGAQTDAWRPVLPDPPKCSLFIHTTNKMSVGQTIILGTNCNSVSLGELFSLWCNKGLASLASCLPSYTKGVPKLFHVLAPQTPLAYGTPFRQYYKIRKERYIIFDTEN